MSKRDKCPKCGAEFVGRGASGGREYLCGSYIWKYARKVQQSDQCKDNQIAALLADNERLSASIVTEKFMRKNSDDEAERLRGIVDKLPKDADGDAVVIGGRYWINSATEASPYEVTVLAFHLYSDDTDGIPTVIVTDEWNTENDCDMGVLHKTREAAAAKENDDGV